MTQEQLAVYIDDECGMCTRASWWMRGAGVSAEFRPLAEADSVGGEIIVRSPTATYEGADAIAVVLRSSTQQRWRLVGRLIAMRGISTIARTCYRLVAKNRRWVSMRLGLGACPLPSRLDSEDNGGRGL